MNGNGARALAVGGLDPSCGAGVVLDAFVLASLGYAPATVVATVTAQNSARFLASSPVKTAVFLQQLDAVADAPFACVKVGALGSAKNLCALAAFLRGVRHGDPGLPVVVDPVLMSSTGGELFPAGETDVYGELCRVASVITPNAQEAARLIGAPVSDVAGAKTAARLLARRWGCAVVVTGVRPRGEEASAEVVDVVWEGERADAMGHPFVFGADEVRGTGCAFSSALAAGLARGDELTVAVGAAQRTVASLVANARRQGAGRPQADFAVLMAAGEAVSRCYAVRCRNLPAQPS